MSARVSTKPLARKRARLGAILILALPLLILPLSVRAVAPVQDHRRPAHTLPLGKQIEIILKKADANRGRLAGRARFTVIQGGRSAAGAHY